MDFLILDYFWYESRRSKLINLKLSEITLKKTCVISKFRQNKKTLF